MAVVLDAPCVIPSRSLEQRMEALAHANTIRMMRAQLKRDLKAGRVRLADVIASPPREAMTAKVFDLLLAAPKLGRVKVDRILRDAKISPSKMVGGLTERQRGVLVDRVDPYGALQA